jgi:hypothetical protein
VAENLSSSLSTLIGKADDPKLLDYVIQHLGTDVPPDLRPKALAVARQMRQLASDRKLTLEAAISNSRMRAAARRQMRPLAAAALTRGAVASAGQRAFATSILFADAAVRSELQSAQFLQTRLDADATLREQSERRRALLREGSAALVARLRDKDRSARLEAIAAVVVRRAPAEGELIGLLDDRDAEVRKAAHKAIVFLARGTDFGPPADAERCDRVRATARWELWWSEQDGNPRRAATATATAQPAPPPGIAGDKPAEPAEARVMSFALETIGGKARRLAAALAAAEGREREALIAEYCTRKGGDYSDALVAAVTLVEADQRGPIREALAERLARMTPATLQARLADEEPEYRRAAARATAQREDRTSVPWLIPLLDDVEPAVGQAAHAALKLLTKQDLGPEPGADRADRVLSIVAWSDWWKREGQNK